MKHKILTILLATFFCFAVLPANAVATHDFSDAELKASALKNLNLFQGISNSDFALERTPTRIESLIMFIRMIGAEDAAISNKGSHPFTDVPTWADGYVGYAYDHGFTNGINATKFGTNDPANAAIYLTFTLRALGYSDESAMDFSWDNPFPLARSTEILSENVDTQDFLRADIALISWNALSVPMNGGNKSLADLLVMSGVFTQDQYDTAVDLVKNGAPNSNINIKLGQYTCYTDVYGFTYESIYRPTFTLYNDKTFDITVNYGEGMSTGSGRWNSVTLDSGETALYLNVDTNGWTETYCLILSNGTFILDGWMGITPEESIFRL